MSLRIWMPLRGDVENQGLSSVETAKSGASLFTTTTGKLTSAYYNTTAGHGAYIFNYMDELKTYENYSLCAWVRLVSSAVGHTSIIVSGSGNWNNENQNFLFGLYNFSSDKYLRLIVPSTGTWNSQLALSEGIALNKWYHIAITYDGTVTKAYVNGEYSGQRSGGGICSGATNTFLKIGASTYSSNYTLKGAMNDFRIYDHCLSTKEIKEISKALLLHYKLDGTTIEGTNEFDCSGYRNDGKTMGSPALVEGSPKYEYCTEFGGSSKYTRAFRGAMTKDAISVCLWVYMSNWSTYGKSARMISCTQAGGWNFESASTGEIRFLAYASGTSEAGYVFAKDNVTAANLSSGWHHFVGTYDKDADKVCYYRDGNFISSASTGNRPLGYHSQNGIFIGAEANTDLNFPTTPYFDGRINDVRIYATALSPEDVAELYHTPASIDNKGNFYCGEIKEE